MLLTNLYLHRFLLAIFVMEFLRLTFRKFLTVTRNYLLSRS